MSIWPVGTAAQLPWSWQGIYQSIHYALCAAGGAAARTRALRDQWSAPQRRGGRAPSQHQVSSITNSMHEIENADLD